MAATGRSTDAFVEEHYLLELDDETLDVVEALRNFRATSSLNKLSIYEVSDILVNYGMDIEQADIATARLSRFCSDGLLNLNVLEERERLAIFRDLLRDLATQYDPH